MLGLLKSYKDFRGPSEAFRRSIGDYWGRLDCIGVPRLIGVPGFSGEAHMEHRMMLVTSAHIPRGSNAVPFWS